jgi:hypothetical protein
MSGALPVGLEPALQYATPLVIRRYRSSVAFNHYQSSLPLQVPNIAIINAAAITSRT